MKKVSKYHLLHRFSTISLRLACPLAISVPLLKPTLHMGMCCSSLNYVFQKNDDNEVKSISLMHSLKFERKCEKSNKWTCPAVTFCRAFCSRYYFYAVLFPTSARNLQWKMLKSWTATDNYFHLNHLQIKWPFWFSEPMVISQKDVAQHNVQIFSLLSQKTRIYSCLINT